MTEKIQFMKLEPSTMQRVEQLIDQLSMAAQSCAESVKQRLQLLLNTPDFVNKLFALKTDICATGAGELLIRLYPTDLFFELLTAVRAGDINSFAIE